MSLANIDRGSCEDDEQQKPQCDVCEVNGDGQSARGFCVDCTDFMCSKCCLHHKRLNATRSHTILEGDKLPSNARTIKRKQVLIDHCLIHADRLIEYFCTKCDCLLCSACVTMRVCGCSKVELIEELLAKRINKMDVNTVILEANKLSKEIENHKNTVQSNSDDIDKYTKGACQNLENQGKRLNEYCVALANDVVDNSRKETQNMSTVEYSRCQLLQNVRQVTVELEKRNGDRQKVQQFIQTTRYRQELSEFSARLSWLKGDSMVNFTYSTTPLFTVQGDQCIANGKTYTIPMCVNVPSLVLAWEFSSSPSDIGISISYKSTDDGDSTVLKPLVKCNSHLRLEQGHIVASRIGVYTLVFDNTYSKIRDKNVKYKLSLKMVEDCGLGQTQAAK